MAPLRRVLFIVPYPLREAPSQRFRFEQYFPALATHAIEFDVESFLTKSNWRVFYGPGKGLKKALSLLGGFWRRTVGLFGIWRYDFVFIHREAAPIGPPVFEWVIAKVFRKRIIYDYDDAIWLTDHAKESALNRLIKNRGKVATICRLSYRVSCGNSYLADYARKYNTAVTLNPTTIDTESVHNAQLVGSTDKEVRHLTVGWTGSHSTLKYLEAIEPVLQEVERQYPNVSFLVIADKPAKLNLSRITFTRWSEASEVADLMKVDIGVMPLPDDEWSKGKCGFKILQYMSLGIPSVSAAVGANKEIVTPGQNGFLCATEQEWLQHLKTLIEDPSLRQQFGAAGRGTVLQRYCVNSNTATFLSLFE